MNTLNSASAAILGAVLNTLWQAAAATVLVWLAMRYTRLSAAARHRAWWAWLAILLLLPAIPPLVRSARISPATPRVERTVARAAAVYQRVTSFVPIAAVPVSDVRPGIEVKVRRGPLVALGIWLAFVLFQAARLFWSFLHLRRLKAEARAPKLALRENFEAWTLACGVRRPVRLLISDRLASPMAVGFLYPAVILPESLIDSMSEEDMDHVILHELAHIARRDDWTNLIARAAVALLGWHPAAAWVLRRIDREREIACDDWVVAATGQPRPYAASLARLFELCWIKNREALATGMAGSGSHLGERIEMLVRRTGTPRSLARAAVCGAFLLALLIAGAKAPRLVAFAQDRPARAVARQQAVRPLPPANSQSFLAALVAAGYGDLSVDDMIALKNRGISGDFLRGVSQAGWGKLTAPQLIDLRTRGVSPEYLRDSKDTGIKDLNIQGVIDMRTRGVNPDYPREIHALGFGPYTVHEIIDLRTRGVSPELFRALKDGGFTQLSPNEIFEAQRSGLQGANLREAKQFGAKLSLGQIIRLKRAGVI
jgi:beta-lactamase regulating signal transducer with metallopeptidase domain